MFSRFLHIFFILTRPMTLGVRGLLISPENTVLLVRHSYHSGWHLPGGGVHKDETLETALTREVQEEAAVNILGKPKLHGMFLNNKVSKRDHVAVYICEKFEEIPNQKLSWEISERRFFPLDSLPPELDGGTKIRISEYLEKQEVALFW